MKYSAYFRIEESIKAYQFQVDKHLKRLLDGEIPETGIAFVVQEAQKNKAVVDALTLIKNDIDRDEENGEQG